MKPYNRIIWKDHVTDPATGEPIQEGTPQSATNFNNAEEGIMAGDTGMAVLAQQVLQHKRLLSDLEGEIDEASMTNTLEYPFNNSDITVNLLKTRDTLNYRVDTEVVSSTGIVGDIVVYDKQLNGFKIRYTGSATAATVKYYVIGGMYQ